MMALYWLLIPLAYLATNGWLVLAGMIWAGWLHLYGNGVRLGWLESIVYVLALYRLADFAYAIGYRAWRDALPEHVSEAAKARIVEASRAGIIAEYLAELPEPPIDPIREAMERYHRITEADMIAVCDAYRAYEQNWYQVFQGDPSGMDYPLKSFAMWWRDVLDPAGAEMADYAQYLNSREEAIHLGAVPEYAALCFNDWKERTNIHEAYAWQPTGLGRMALYSRGIKAPRHPDFYHRPLGFYVTNPTA